jgi:hypothetical protein
MGAGATTIFLERHIVVYSGNKPRLKEFDISGYTKIEISGYTKKRKPQCLSLIKMMTQYHATNATPGAEEGARRTLS